MKRFDWKTFIKMVAVIAVPVALQNLLTTTGSMVDTVMIAALGETTVGAVGLCAQFTSLMFSCYWGFVGGGMLFISQFWGAKDDRGINRSYGLMMIFMMISGIGFGLMGVLAPEWVMRMYTDKVSIQQIGVQYMRIVGFAYPLQVLAMCMSALLRSIEKVKIPLYASIAALLANMGINYVLIYGKFGFPMMGVRGAAIGTVVSAIVNVAVILSAAMKGKDPYILNVREHFKFDKALTKDYLIKSFPMICNELFIGGSFMAINIVLGRQAEEAIVALAVYRTLEGFIIGFFSGMSNAATVLIGKPVGEGAHDVAWARAKRLVLLCPCVICAACMLIFLLRTPLLTAMGLSGESYTIGVGMLAVYWVAATIRLTNWLQNDTFRAAGDPVYGTVREITCAYIFVVPSVILTGMVWKLPFLVVFACTFIDEPLRLGMMLYHTWHGRWIKPVTAEGQATLEEFRKRNGIDMKAKRPFFLR